MRADRPAARMTTPTEIAGSIVGRVTILQCRKFQPNLQGFANRAGQPTEVVLQ